MDIMKAIADIGIVPVINVTELETARPLAGALRKGGIPILEITLRNELALQAIREVIDEYPDMHVLAGTILSVEQAGAALDAGAAGLVMPCYDEEIIAFAQARGVPVVPSCTTATDIQKGVKQGLTVFKFFPAEPNGGIDAIKLLSGPFRGIKFIPTGGINYNNLGSYLKEPSILACGGSFMAKAELLKNRNFDAITANCQRAMEISLGFELAHVGINHENEEKAAKTAETIASLFHMSARYMNSAVFSGTAVEAVKHMGYGTKGHIGFYTNSIDRAMAYLQSKGVELEEESIKRNAAGQITCIYLKQEIAGFAFHIVAR